MSRRAVDVHGVVHDVYLDHADYHYYEVTECGRRADLPEFRGLKDGAPTTCLKCVTASGATKR